MTAAVLEADRVVAGYAPDLPVLRGVSVGVAAGEIVTVIGPNGAGKSTLARACAGLVALTGGAVRLRGRDITAMPTHARAAAGLGYVPQTGNVFTSLTVHENLLVGGQPLGRGLAARVERVYAIFPDLAARRRARGLVLSGGQRQLLALARALVVEPVALILDEPTAGLAPRVAAGVFDRVRALARDGVAVLMIEQNARAALGASDRAYVLADGENRLAGRAAALLDDPAIRDLYLGGGGRGRAG